MTAYSFGTTTVELEVDSETGKIKVEHIVAVNDYGTVLNPLLVRGNMHHGQINFMLGPGLMEQNVWNPKTGKKLTSTLGTYKVPTANETPEIETYFLGIPDLDGPYGAKEGSLGFGCGLHGAISNTIHDATGVWVYDKRCLKSLKRTEKSNRSLRLRIADFNFFKPVTMHLS